MSNCSGLYLASKARAGAGESAPPPTASSRAIVPLSLSLPASQFIASEQLCWASSAEEAAWRPETAAARLLKEAGGAVTGAMLEKEIATTVSHALRNWQPEPAPRVVDVTITYSQGGVPVVDTFQWDLGDFIGCMTGPEVFTERLCGEIGLDAAEYERILESIRQQLQS